jgi:hypothetical protein
VTGSGMSSALALSSSGGCEVVYYQVGEREDETKTTKASLSDTEAWETKDAELTVAVGGWLRAASASGIRA